MMLFDDGDAALLKKWIVKRLEDMYVLLSSPPPLSLSPPNPPRSLPPVAGSEALGNYHRTKR